MVTTTPRRAESAALGHSSGSTPCGATVIGVPTPSSANAPCSSIEQAVACTAAISPSRSRRRHSLAELSSPRDECHREATFWKSSRKGTPLL